MQRESAKGFISISLNIKVSLMVLIKEEMNIFHVSNMLKIFQKYINVFEVNSTSPFVWTR